MYYFRVARPVEDQQGIDAMPAALIDVARLKIRKDLPGLPSAQVYGGVHRRLRELGRAYLAERT